MEMRKKALITGITGQDGSYLAEFLLEKGYEVHGIIRRSSSFNTERIDHLFQEIHQEDRTFILHYGDITDGESLGIIKKHQFDEIYNLAAQSHVRVSFDLPLNTSDITALGPLRILEKIRKFSPKTKFYQASSSEMFGKVSETPQTENTPFYPRSPYGCSKLFAYNISRNYREGYGIFACNGILFNHESERRGETFVTRKITRVLSRIRLGLDKKLYLGNLNAKRDWGHAKDYVKAMWLMLQQDKPEDYVISTGETHTVREFVERAAKHLGFDIVWEGEGINEKGIDKNTGDVIVEIDPKYFRPTEVEILLGDYSKAKNNLGWEPEISFDEMVSLMVKNDLEKTKREKILSHL